MARRHLVVSRLRHVALQWRPLRVVRGHPRLFLAIAAGLAIWAILPESERLATRLLIAWNAGAWFYFISAGIMIARATPQTLRERAAASDEGRLFILLLASLAAITSMAAIAAELASVKDMTGLDKGMHVGLAAMTILSAWLVIHLSLPFIMRMNISTKFRTRPANRGRGAGG
jgi:uncharacterized membrane protein